MKINSRKLSILFIVVGGLIVSTAALLKIQNGVSNSLLFLAGFACEAIGLFVIVKNYMSAKN